MFTNFAEFFVCLREARFGFRYILKSLWNLFQEIIENPDISVILDSLRSHLAAGGKILAVALIFLSIIVACFGKKIIGFLKFCFFFGFGFAFGIHFLSPIISSAVNIPAWIVGVVVALVSAVLYRFLYVVAYTAVIGYSSYILFYHGFFLQCEPVYSNTRAVFCVVLSIAVLILAFALQKYIEMAGTALVGGLAASIFFVKKVYDLRKLSIFAGSAWLGIIVPALIVAVIGFIVQIKTRRRY